MNDPEAFSVAGYRAILDAARASGYRFARFGELREGEARPGRECLLRHDVDVNVRFALDMARLEAAEGVASTYFVMLRSPAYNLLGRFASAAVREMAELGHEVGVHFDAQHPHVGQDNLVSEVQREAAIIADLVGQPVSAVSFHQPSEFILRGDIVVPGLINTYNKRQLAGWHYVSDANRQWKQQSPCQLLSSAAFDKIQLLIHPMWWICDAPRTEDVWDEAVKDNFETMQRQFLETERAYGPARSIALARDGDANA